MKLKVCSYEESNIFFFRFVDHAISGINRNHRFIFSESQKKKMTKKIPTCGSTLTKN